MLKEKKETNTVKFNDKAGYYEKKGRRLETELALELATVGKVGVVNVVQKTPKR